MDAPEDYSAPCPRARPGSSLLNYHDDRILAVLVTALWRDKPARNFCLFLNLTLNAHGTDGTSGEFLEPSAQPPGVDGLGEDVLRRKAEKLTVKDPRRPSLKATNTIPFGFCPAELAG